MLIVVQMHLMHGHIKSNFDAKPTTSSFVSALGGKNDEVHIAVIDEDGLISGAKDTVLETFPFLSVAKNAKNC